MTPHEPHGPTAIVALVYAAAARTVDGRGFALVHQRANGQKEPSIRSVGGAPIHQQEKQRLVEMSVNAGRPTITGECDVSSTSDIETWLGEFDAEPLEVDLSGVTFFDSTALRGLLNVRRRNQHMRIINPSRPVLKILEITDTIEYLVEGRDIFD